MGNGLGEYMGGGGPSRGEVGTSGRMCSERRAGRKVEAT